MPAVARLLTIVVVAKSSGGRRGRPAPQAGNWPGGDAGQGDGGDHQGDHRGWGRRFRTGERGAGRGPRAWLGGRAWLPGSTRIHGRARLRRGSRLRGSACPAGRPPFPRWALSGRAWRRARFFRRPRSVRCARTRRPRALRCAQASYGRPMTAQVRTVRRFIRRPRILRGRRFLRWPRPGRARLRWARFRWPRFRRARTWRPWWRIRRARALPRWRSRLRWPHPPAARSRARRTSPVHSALGSSRRVPFPADRRRRRRSRSTREDQGPGPAGQWVPGDQPPGYGAPGFPGGHQPAYGASGFPGENPAGYGAAGFSGDNPQGQGGLPWPDGPRTGPYRPGRTGPGPGPNGQLQHGPPPPHVATGMAQPGAPVPAQFATDGHAQPQFFAGQMNAGHFAQSQFSAGWTPRRASSPRPSSPAAGPLPTGVQGAQGPVRPCPSTSMIPTGS